MSKPCPNVRSNPALTGSGVSQQHLCMDRKGSRNSLSAPNNTTAANTYSSAVPAYEGKSAWSRALEVTGVGRPYRREHARTRPRPMNCSTPALPDHG